MKVPRAVFTWALVASVVAGSVVLRVLHDGRVSLRAGQDAQAHGRTEDAVRHLRLAAHAYLPGSPYTRMAYERLEAIAREAETRGRYATALAAWQAVRSSALGTRWMIVPYADRLARADEHLARLLAMMPQAPVDREATTARMEERYLAMLREDHAPDPAWLVVVGVGFALWLGAILRAASVGWDDDDRPRYRVLARCAAVFAPGLVFFVAGLLRA